MRRVEKGTTLIEVMLALFVFSIGILSVAQMQIAGLSCSTKATRNMYNSVSAGNMVERMLSLPINDPHLTDIDGGYFPDNPDHGPVTISNTRSTMEWEVEDDFVVKGMKRVTVTIRWQAKDGSPRSLTFASVITDPIEARSAF